MSRKIKLLSLLLVLPVSLLAMEKGFSSFRGSNEFVVDLVKSTFRSNLENNAFDFERSLEELKEEISGNISGDWNDVEKVYLQKSGNASCPVTGFAQLASGASDKSVRIWDSNAGVCLQILRGHGSYVDSVAYSPNGTQLASGSVDKTIKIWDSSSGICLRTLSGHSESICSIAYSPNGNQLASGSSDKTIKIWDSSSGVCLRTLSGHSESIYSIAYSPNGNQLASAALLDKSVRIWNPNTGVCLQMLSVGGPNAVAYSPVGTQLAIADWRLKIVDLNTANCLFELGGHERISSIAYSPDGSQLASGSSDKTIKIWDTHAGNCLRILNGHSGNVESVAYSSDGKQLASGSRDGTLRIWNPNTGACLRTLIGSEAWFDQGKWVNTIAYSHSPVIRKKEEIVPRETFERLLLIYASELLKKQKNKKILAAKLFACSLFKCLNEEERAQLWISAMQ